MKKPIIIYNLLVVAVIMIAGFVYSPEPTQKVLSLLFIPVALYFVRQLSVSFAAPNTSTAITPTRIFPRRNRQAKSVDGEVIDPEILSDSEIKDINRRLFLKLIGSAGLATFTFSLFTKRTHAAFFGSVPGPGTVNLKDSNDNVIDPAEKQPTDGYEIADIDDASTPAYYGFLDKDGNWYIAREDSAGRYRYNAGTTAYNTNWTNRASLVYDFFDTVF